MKTKEEIIKEFEEKIPLIKPYQFIFVHIKESHAQFEDAASVLTQFGTGYMCHVEVKLPTIEYKGKQMSDLVCCAGGSLMSPRSRYCQW